jgi:hypothetical protein
MKMASTGVTLRILNVLQDAWIKPFCRHVFLCFEGKSPS